MIWYDIYIYIYITEITKISCVIKNFIANQYWNNSVSSISDGQ